MLLTIAWPMLRARTSWSTGGAATNASILPSTKRSIGLVDMLETQRMSLGGIKPDRPGHDLYQHPVLVTAGYPDSPAFKVRHGPDVVPAEHFEASNMQAGQDSNGCASFHCHDERWHVCPAKIHLAMRQHIAQCLRPGSLRPAQVRLGHVDIADIRKTLGMQQVLGSLRCNTGYRIFLKA